MTPLQYSLAAIVSMMGFWLGIWLEHSAREELESLKKYLFFMKRIVFAAIIGLAMHFLFGIVWVDTMAFVLAFLLAFFMGVYDAGIYLVLSLAFFLASSMASGFPAVASLIFLYGLPAGSLMAHRLMRRGKSAVFGKAFKASLTFLALCAVLYLAQNIIKP